MAPSAVTSAPIVLPTLSLDPSLVSGATGTPDNPELIKKERERRMMEEKMKRLGSVGIGREAAEAILLRKQLGKRAISQYGGDIPTVRTRRASVIASVSHSTAANTNRNVKLDLTEFELYHFHRPRLPKSMFHTHAAATSTTSNNSQPSLSTNNSHASNKIWQVYYNFDFYQIKPLSSVALSKHFKNRHSATTATGSSSARSTVGEVDGHQEYLNSLSLDRRKHMQPKPSLYSETEKQNLSISAGEVVCIEYIEETLPVFLHHGMASAILNYFRLPLDKSQNEDYEAIQQRDKAQALEQSILSSHNRIPRFLSLLLTSQEQKNVNDNSYLNSNIDIPKLFYGETKILKKDDETPFLGDIDECDVQPSISNTLFKAPIFEHKPNSNDFLLVRIKQPPIKVISKSTPQTATTDDGNKEGTKGNDENQNKDNPTISTKEKNLSHQKTICFTVREMNTIFLCGQLEPIKIVPKPNNRIITKVQEKMILLAAARFFRTVGGANSGSDGK